MTEKRYKEVSEFDDDLIHITCPKCKYPMRVLAKDNKGIYQCYCASCGFDRFMKDTLDEDNLTFKEFNRCVERGKAIDIERLFDFIYEQHEQIERLKRNFRALDEVKCELADENEQLKQELFESEKEWYECHYADNPVRLDSKLEALKEEFKERFGRDFE